MSADAEASADKWHIVVTLKDSITDGLNLNYLHCTAGDLARLSCGVQELKKQMIELQDHIREMNVKVDTLWLAPGMPGAKEAESHFNTLPASQISEST